MHTLLKEFSNKKVLAYARTIQEEGHVGPTLFPIVNTNELSFEYWKSVNVLPVSANLQAYGAEASIAGRDGATKVTGEIPPIKRKISLGEREMVALKREGAGDVDFVRNTLFNDIDNMVAAVYAKIEALRMMAVATGKLTLNENGVILNVDYGVPSDQQDPPTHLWSDSVNRTIISDIQSWTGVVEDATGIRPTRALTSDTVVAYMLADQTIREMIWGPVGDNRPVTLQEINRLLQTMDLPQIASYNRRYRLQSDDGTYTTTRYFPADKFVLMPPEKLGDTLMGPTAESLMDDAVEAKNVAGIYANVVHENEPPIIWTKASATAIPTFPAAELVYQATVLDLS